MIEGEAFCWWVWSVHNSPDLLWLGSMPKSINMVLVGLVARRTLQRDLSIGRREGKIPRLEEKLWSERETGLGRTCLVYCTLVFRLG